jgi:hypothetical protein
MWWREGCGYVCSAEVNGYGLTRNNPLQHNDPRAVGADIRLSGSSEPCVAGGGRRKIGARMPEVLDSTSDFANLWPNHNV